MGKFVLDTQIEPFRKILELTPSDEQNWFWSWLETCKTKTKTTLVLVL